MAFKKAIALRPDEAEYHFSLATVYRRQRNTDDAIAEYKAAVARDGKHARAWYDLGILYSQEKNTEGAKEAFEKYLEYGTSEDAASRRDAEDRLKTFKGYDEGQKAQGPKREKGKAAK